MKNSKEVYVVIAYRFGSNENHSYTLGVFNKKHKAIECAETHATHRGGKYDCVVEECIINQFDNLANEYVKEVYRTGCINKPRL